MYFKYGYKPKKIASKLRLCNTEISFAVYKFKRKANDFIYGMGFDPYKQEIPLAEFDKFVKQCNDEN